MACAFSVRDVEGDVVVVDLLETKELLRLELYKLDPRPAQLDGTALLGDGHQQGEGKLERCAMNGRCTLVGDVVQWHCAYKNQYSYWGELAKSDETQPELWHLAAGNRVSITEFGLPGGPPRHPRRIMQRGPAQDRSSFLFPKLWTRRNSSAADFVP